jgi:hypothetical protein
MPTKLDPGQDERGKQLAENSSVLDQHGAKPLNASEQSSLDQIESGLKGDKTNSKPDDKGLSKSGASPLGAKNGKLGSTSFNPNAGMGSSADSDKGIGDKVGKTIGPRNAGQMLKYINANRKKFGIGSGITGLIAIIIFGFFALLPLKIESMMNNIFSDHFDKTLNHAVERRAERMFFKYAMTSSNAAGTDKVVATGNPLLDLYATWKLANFETQLKTKYGLDLEKAGPGRISIKTPSEGIKYFDLEHPEAMREYYTSEGPLTRRESRNFIKDAVKNETKWYQIVKRHHLRTWMKNAYGIRGWKIFDKAKDKAAAKENFVSKTKQWFTDKFKEKFTKAFSCVLGEKADCPDGDNGKSDSPDKKPGASKDAEKAVSGAVDEVAEKTAAKEFFDEVVKVMSKKGLSKAIPILGWVDLAARIDDFLWHDRADKIIEDMRKSQYAASFAQGQVMASQQKSGENTSGYDIGEVMDKANGIEKSCRYQELYNGKRQANCVNIDPDKHVKAINGQRIKDALYKYNPQMKATHYVLAAYLASLGKIIDKVGDLIGWLFEHLISPVIEHTIGAIPGVKDALSFITGTLADLFKAIFAPGCTGNEKGAEWFICVDGGGEVVEEEYMQQVGGKKVSASAAAQIDAQVAKENAADTASKDLWYRVASTANPHSFVMRLAGGMPSSPSDAVAQSADSMVASLSTFGINIAKALTTPFVAALTPAYADADESITGVDHYRFTEGDLDKDINEDDLKSAQAKATIAGRPDDIHPEDCPNADSEPNLCKLDIVTIQSLKSMFTDKDDGGIGSDAANNNGGQSPNGTACTNVPAGGAGEPPSDYGRNTSRGVTLNNRTLWMLQDAEKRAGGGKFRLMQGSYNKGGVGASGGTHDGGGAMDIAPGNVNAQLKALREAGFAAWYRTPAEGFPYHIHAIAIGDKEMSPSAAIQIKNYFDGDDGLVGPARDTAPASVGRPIPDWAKKYGNCK